MEKDKIEIQAPIEVFNNIIKKFTEDISEILNESDMPNNIYFIEDTINIYGWIKIYRNKYGEVKIKVLKGIDNIDFKILFKIEKNWPKITTIFWYYLMMYNKIATNVDDVPVQLINQIFGEIQTGKKNEYLLPFKNKLSKLDLEVDFYQKFEYFFCFENNPENSVQFKFKIKKVIINNKNKNIPENLRYEEIDIIHTGTYRKFDAYNFINELFIYGNILYK